MPTRSSRAFRARSASSPSTWRGSSDKPYAVEVVTCTWDALWHRGGVQGKLYAPISCRNNAASRRRRARSSSTSPGSSSSAAIRRAGAPSRARTSSFEPLSSDAVLDARLEAIGSGARPTSSARSRRSRRRFKGVQTALEALGAAARACRLRVQVVGAGDPAPWRELAERHGVGDRVSFLGVLPTSASSSGSTASISTSSRASRRACREG